MSGAPVNRAGRSYLTWSLRLLGTAVALGIVFAIVPIDEVLSAAARLPLALWLAALGLFLIAHALTAAKWWVLIGGRGSFGQIYKAHLAGLGANLALPGVAGGDVVRALIIIREQGNGERVAAGSIIDRLVDTASLALIALLGFWAVAAGDWTISGLLWRLVVLTALASVVLAVLARLHLPQGAAGEGAGKIRKLLFSIGSALAQLARTPSLMVFSLVLSIAAQVLLIGINVALASALALELPFAVWAYGWSIAKLIAILPISLGGLGVREASLATLFQPFGADPALVVAVGLIWQTILYASGIIGILVGALVSRRGNAGQLAKRTAGQ